MDGMGWELEITRGFIVSIFNTFSRPDTMKNVICSLIQATLCCSPPQDFGTSGSSYNLMPKTIAVDPQVVETYLVKHVIQHNGPSRKLDVTRTWLKTHWLPQTRTWKDYFWFERLFFLSFAVGFKFQIPVTERFFGKWCDSSSSSNF